MKFDPYAKACPTRKLLDRIANKWTVLVLGLLMRGPCRFSVLKRQIGGISQKMLTQTLRDLESDGLVTRHVFATVPVTVEYRLTPRGESLNAVLAPLIAWSERNMVDIERTRRADDGGLQG